VAGSQYAMKVTGIERESSCGLRPWAGFVVAAALAWACGCPAIVAAADAARGRELLLEKAYLPADFDQEVFDELWTLWPEPLRGRAERAPVEERRRMAGVGD
jgi:hypothetical protein